MPWLRLYASLPLFSVWAAGTEEDLLQLTRLLHIIPNPDVRTSRLWEVRETLTFLGRDFPMWAGPWPRPASPAPPLQSTLPLRFKPEYSKDRREMLDTPPPPVYSVGQPRVTG